MKELCEHWRPSGKTGKVLKAEYAVDHCVYCEAQQNREMYSDAVAELDMLREALRVPYEPHQTLFERMMDAARAASNRGEDHGTR